MSIRKETATRDYYAWVVWPTKKQAEVEARGYRKRGQKCQVAYNRKHKGWVVWRWRSKKRKR